MHDTSLALIIPCYKCADTIEEVLTSAFEQVVPFDEILCYLDGPDPHLKELINSLGNRYPQKIRIVEGLENKGPAFARNVLMRASRCNYISPQDADDPLDPEYVQIIKPLLRRSRLVINRYQIIEKNGEIRLTGPATIPTDISPTFILEMPPQLNSTAFEKQHALEIGGFNEKMRYHEDREFLLRYALQGGNIYYVPKVLSSYRKFSTSAGGIRSEKEWRVHDGSFLSMIDSVEPLLSSASDEFKTKWNKYLHNRASFFYGKHHREKLASRIGRSVRPESRSGRLLKAILSYRGYILFQSTWRKITHAG